MAMTIAANSTVKNGLKVAASLLGVGVALNTIVVLAPGKFSSATDYPNRITITLARLVGPTIASKITGINTNIPQGVNPWGPFNSTTYAGAILLITDWAIHMFVGSKYGYHYASPFFKAVGGGLLVGGIIGGLLDPPGAGSTGGRTGGVAGFGFSNAAAGRSVMGFTGVS